MMSAYYSHDVCILFIVSAYYSHNVCILFMVSAYYTFMNLHNYATFMYHMTLLYTCVCVCVYVHVCVLVCLCMCVCACPKEALHLPA